MIALGVILFGGDGGHKYNLLFQNASQLVPDNQVLIGGQPVGSVESIELTDDNLAEVKISVEQELHEGTTAVIRATSLSGVANHYVSISPGPNDNPPLDDGATLGLAETTTPADLDQLFNTFPPRVRRGLADFIQGQRRVLRGPRPGRQRGGYKYFGPSLNRTNAFVGELQRRPAPASNDFVVNSGKLSTAVAERGDKLSNAISNASTAFDAIARQNVAFSQHPAPAAAGLPPEQHDLRQPARRPRRPRPAGRNGEAGDQGPRPVPGRTAPGHLRKRCRSSRTCGSPCAGRARPTTPRELLAALPDGPAARREGLPALRRGDRRLPAEPQLRPRLHAGHLQRLRQARPGHRLLRRQRPLRADLLRRPQHLQLQRRRTETDPAEPAVRSASALRRNGQAPLPGRRHPAGRRRLQPVRRTAVRGLRRHLVPVQPRRRATGTMSSERALIALGCSLAAVVARRPDRLRRRRRQAATSSAAIFDNGSFMVKGEQVRVAGANVGEVESVGVTMPGEIDSYENGRPRSDPGQGGDRDEDHRPGLPGLPRRTPAA